MFSSHNIVFPTLSSAKKNILVLHITQLRTKRIKKKHIDVKQQKNKIYGKWISLKWIQKKKKRLGQMSRGRPKRKLFGSAFSSASNCVNRRRRTLTKIVDSNQMDKEAKVFIGAGVAGFAAGCFVNYKYKQQYWLPYILVAFGGAAVGESSALIYLGSFS